MALYIGFKCTKIEKHRFTMNLIQKKHAQYNISFNFAKNLSTVTRKTYYTQKKWKRQN